MKLFGFEIKRKEEEPVSFAQPINDDGAVVVTAAETASGHAYGTFVDLEGTAKNEAELVTKYRNLLIQPECSRAVDDIVNETIVVNEGRKVVECVTDDIKHPESIKKKIRDEFEEVLTLLDFSNKGYEIFQKWYVDGRSYYHAIVDEQKSKEGIQELRYIDPRKIRKIKEVEKIKENGFEVQKLKNEYYLFTEKSFMTTNSYNVNNTAHGIKIAKDSIIHVTSGLVNENNTLVLSHMHKSIKPVNQLRMLEDAAVIYRISRAPERRIFYIDVGNLPKVKAEQYLRDMMTKHKNKLVYDATTGEVRDDRKFMTMLEDFWLPRREGGRGTEITTLPGGQNLGEIEDILYFQKKLYQSLNVPIGRMDSENVFNIGRSQEITRDEVKFSKFIVRLRARFSDLFNSILEKQLILKGIVSYEDWVEIKNTIRYNFMEDNHFQELKEGEILRQRTEILRDMEEYVGKYYSQEWVRKNVLRQTEDDIKEIDKQIKSEPDPDDEDDEREPEPRPELNPEPKPEPKPEPETKTEEKNLLESMSKFMELSETAQLSGKKV